MRTWALAFGISAVSFVMLSIPGDAAEKDAGWKKKMRDLQQTLEEILIDVSSDERFNSPKNFKRIEKNAEALAKHAHDLKGMSMPSSDHDPTMKIISGVFDEEAEHAYKSLRQGHRAYARSLLKATTSYCLACHTRNASGPSFQVSGPGGGIQEKLESLKEFDQANYYAATRQFDKALETYERLISDPKAAGKRPFEWQAAVRTALSIAVRVKRDPVRAGAIIDRAISMKNAPGFFVELASQWRASIKHWEEEGARKTATERGLHAEALRLTTAARQLQKYPADRSADVLYLRASSTLHDLLSAAPESPRLAEYLYLAGLSYEVLQDLSLWDLHEFYYLACMDRAPHSTVARQCYNQYEESVYAGYTGSAGSSLPTDVQQRLEQLRKLSRPSDGSTESKEPN